MSIPCVDCEGPAENIYPDMMDYPALCDICHDGRLFDQEEEEDMLSNWNSGFECI